LSLSIWVTIRPPTKAGKKLTRPVIFSCVKLASIGGRRRWPVTNGASDANASGAWRFTADSGPSRTVIRRIADSVPVIADRF
jgi:hypothetical protein